MDILVPAVNAAVVAVATLVVVWVGKERGDALERKMDQGFAHVDKRFAQVDKQFDQVDKQFDQVDKRFDQVGREMGEMRSEMAILRSDLTHVAMAVGARPQPNAG